MTSYGEDGEGNVVEKLPDLSVLQLRFLLSQPELDASVVGSREQLKDKLMEVIVKDKQVSVYNMVCDQFGWQKDHKLLEVVYLCTCVLPLKVNGGRE